MSPLKVGIVEDDILIAEMIKNQLQRIGYLTTPIAPGYQQALEMIAREQPDILLLDINLGKGKKDGIQVAEVLAVDYPHILVIFVTGNADRATVARAGKVAPAAYIVKPFEEDDLFVAIETAMSSYGRKSPKQDEKAAPEDFENFPQQDRAGDSDMPLYYVNDAIFVRHGRAAHKLLYEDILYFESDNQHLFVHTRTGGKYAIRDSLTTYLEFLNSGNFRRVHRGYAINIKYLQSIHMDYLIVGGKEIPLSRTYRQDLLNGLRIS